MVRLPREVPTKQDGRYAQIPVETKSLRDQQTEVVLMERSSALSTETADAASVTFSFELASELLVQAYPCCRASLPGLRRVLLSALGSGDLLGFIGACSQLRFDLCQTGSWEASVSKRSKLRWVRGLVIALEHAIPSNLIVHPSPIFDAVVTFLGWLKRVPVCIRPQHEAEDAYFECDRRLASVNYGANVYIPMLRAIWHEWFGTFRLTRPFTAHHGSGSTADAGRVRHDKWRTLTVDAVAHVCLRGADLQTVIEEDIGTPSRVSRVVFVPKQAGKDRAICMEPAWLQYLQQGVKDQLVAYTHRADHPLSRLVDIFSQEKNRQLCAEAYTSDLATIDLTDASDSVTWALVNELARGLPLLRYLHGTRSTHTDVCGYTVRMCKFAPMGSALCFPIECYVFASIVECAYRQHYGKASGGHHSGCAIYGDDIIVPVEIYHLVVQILESLGFSVNSSKSFAQGGYRESCGVEYLYGASIQSVRHPRAHIHSQDVDESPEKVGLVTDLANTLYAHGYFLARRTLLKSFEGVYVRIGNRRVAFMDLMLFDSEHCVPVDEPYRRSYWNRLLFRREYVAWSCSTVPTSSPSDHLETMIGWKTRSREVRISQFDRAFQEHPIHEKWSNKAVAFLAGSHHWDLLENGDVTVVGQRRAGRLRHRVRRTQHPVGITVP